MASNSLTNHLRTLHRPEFDEAAHHPFLVQAGRGELPAASLCKWLVQDKYYQFAYVDFIQRMISKLDLSTPAFRSVPEDGSSLQSQTFGTLMGASEAIKKEIEFYDDVVQRYHLQLEEEGEDDVTKAYRCLFEESSAEGMPIVCGMTVLWATEYCYLKAWSFALEEKNKLRNVEQTEGAVAALHNEFIPNWTSAEFGSAVEGIANTTNLWAQDSKNAHQKVCEELWLKVLQLEAKFWPSIPQ